MDKPFKPTHVKCVKCDDVIFSRYEGEFRSCKCGSISVDQTKHYERYIGPKALFVFVDEGSI
jgi:hypothetical protein